MKRIILVGLLTVLMSCGMFNKKQPTISNISVKPGTSVTLMGKELKLQKGSLKVGDNFIRKTKKTGIDFKFNNRVTIVNLVPSIDTKVCEAQTHILGETDLPKHIDLVTISRDLPFAQERFAKEAKLENISYFSDYKYGAFGKKTGLTIKGKEILARGVLVLDQKGKVRYMQIVKEITTLPNMQKAFEFAKGL